MDIETPDWNELHDLAETAGHYYDVPEGFVKPDHYPGLGSGASMKAMNDGYVNLGLVDPKGEGPQDWKLRARILRMVVKLLIASPKKQAYIRDPEWVLKEVYPDIKEVISV